MNILTDAPCDFVIIENEKIPVHTDFRNWIKIDSILSDKSMTIEEKIIGVLPLCYKRLPDNIGQAFTAMAEFYNPFCQKGHLKKSSKTLYSFEHDSGYIYSAFLNEYNIDLCTVQMHWHKFLMLMRGLSDKSVFSKIISIRNADISDYTGKQKQMYINLKHLYALPDNFIDEHDTAAEFMSLF